MYDGLGPNYHYLLNHEWFEKQIERLPNVAHHEKLNTVDTALKLKKSI